MIWFTYKEQKSLKSNTHIIFIAVKTSQKLLNKTIILEKQVLNKQFLVQILKNNLKTKYTISNSLAILL